MATERLSPWPKGTPLWPKAPETLDPNWAKWLSNLRDGVNFGAAGNPAAAGTLTGTTLAANVVTSSLVITDGQLSSNAALKNGTNAFTGANSFATNVVDLLVGQLKFPATQNPSADANTLDDYEEGSWTPTDASGAGLVFTFPIPGQYLKIGQLVLATGGVQYPVTASGAAATIGGLPFNGNAGATQYAVPVIYTSAGVALMGLLGVLPSTTIQYFNAVTAAQITNAGFSGKDVRFTTVYRAAA